MTDLYGFPPPDGAAFARACGGNTHPDGEACVTLAKLGPDALALGDSKRPDLTPLRFTTAELHAAGVDPTCFTPST
jgi:hypothetical protein